MASFYVKQIGETSYKLRLPKPPYFELGLVIRVANFQGAMGAVKELREKSKNGQIRFPQLLALFASLHGTYSQPPD